MPEPIEAYEQLDFVAKRRQAQSEDDNGKQPSNPDLAVERYEQKLAEFRAGEAIAHGADDR